MESWFAGGMGGILLPAFDAIGRFQEAGEKLDCTARWPARPSILTSAGLAGQSLPLLAGAGLLVGLGTGIGNGCTSGHGVCGLSRLSLRSLVAVPVFMAAAALTVWLVRHGGQA